MKVRGNAQQVVEKYLALARDAATAGDRIRSESFFQHAEHYYRIMNANGGGQESRENQSRPQGGNNHNDEAQPVVNATVDVATPPLEAAPLTNGAADPVPDPASAPQPDSNATPAAQAD